MRQNIAGEPINYRFNLSEPIEAEFRRIAREEFDHIEELLRDAPEGRQHAVHSARKGLKRLRGLLKLAKQGNPEFARSENERLSQISRHLSRARDADALLETLDRLSTRNLKRKDVTRILPLCVYLEQRRDRIVLEQAKNPTLAREITAWLAESRASFAAASLTDEGYEILRTGYDRILLKARKALKKAHTKRKAEAFHDLRKLLKYHWMHMQLLEEVPGMPQARKKSAEKLSTRLGQLNDIYNMAIVLGQESKAILGSDGERVAEQVAVQVLRKAMRKREGSLRKICLKLSRELLGRNTNLASIENTAR